MVSQPNDNGERMRIRRLNRAQKIYLSRHEVSKVLILARDPLARLLVL